MSESGGDDKSIARRSFTYTVITFGTFDLFHLGHLRLLERAREIAEAEASKRGVSACLVVGVSSDSLNRQKKACATMVPEAERLRIIRALKVVDVCFLEQSLEWKPMYVTEFGANCLVMGDDHAGRFAEVEKHGCERIFLPRTQGVCTTSRVRAIRDSMPNETALASRRAHEECIYRGCITDSAENPNAQHKSNLRHFQSPVGI